MTEEYISRKAAMEYLYRAINADPDGNCPSCVHDEHDCQYDSTWTLMDLCERIEYLGYVPAADVQPVRHGRWERASKSLYACSECGNCVIDERIAGMFYCPNCGAKMDCEEEPFTVETNLYDEEVIHPNCTVQVWRNSQTGEESWGWWENNHNDYVDGRDDEIG